MDIKLFDFDLPEELIAQSPSKERAECRLMVIDKNTQTYEDKHFFDIINYFQKGDVLVINNTKVIPARIFGAKVPTGAKIEALLLKQLQGDTWEALIGNAKACKLDTIISFGDGLLKAKCIKVLDEGIRHLEFFYDGIFLEILEKIGKMPLPPYIKKQCENNDDYQTVYALKEGSSAAPTAGFHFTEELLSKISKMGVEIVNITLSIGLGTFRPVKVSDTKDHIMHSEEYEISKEACDSLNKAKKEKRRIIAVGTTSTRTLEANFTKYGEFKETKESTDIFIYPGISFKAIDCLITNFHLPKSTLIMLVSAFTTREFTLECYKHAVDERYRFFSFGDAMFIHN